MYLNKNLCLFVALLVVTTPIKLLTGPTIILTDQYELTSSGAMGDVTYSVGNLPMGVKIQGNILSIEDRSQAKNGNYYIMVSAKDESGDISNQLVNLVIQKQEEKKNLKTNTDPNVFDREAEAAEVVHNLNLQIEAENQKINQMKGEASQVEDSIAKLQRSQDIDAKKLSILRIQSIIMELTQEIDDLRAKKMRLEDSKRQTLNEKRGVQEQLNKVDQQIKQLRMKIEEDARKRREAQGLIDRESRICVELQSQFQEITEQIRSKGIEKERLGAKKRTVEEKIRRDKQKVYQLQRQLAEARAQVSMGEQQSIQIDSQRQKLDREMTGLRNQLNQISKRINEECRQTQDIDMQQRMAELEEEMKRLNMLLDNINKRLSDIDQQMQEVEVAVKQSQLNLQNLQTNLEELQKQLQQFSKKTKQMQAHLDYLNRLIRQSQGKLRSLTIQHGHAYERFKQFDKATQDILNP